MLYFHERDAADDSERWPAASIALSSTQFLDGWKLFDAARELMGRGAMDGSIRLAGTALVLAHLVISTVHGLAHRGAMVTLTPFGYAYVAVVITILPLVAAALLFSRSRQLGALLLPLSMLGSFVFGVCYHFVASGTDNVAEVHGPWHSTFLWTAIALAICEFIGVIAGLWIYRAVRRSNTAGG